MSERARRGAGALRSWARRTRRAPELVAIAASALVAGCYASHRIGTDGGGTDAGTVEGICLVTCVVDSDCGRGFVCNAEGLCDPGPECASDADCAPSEVCRAARPTLRRECVPRCGRDGRCPIISSTLGGKRCEAGGCVLTGCPSDDWCTAFDREWLGPTVRSRCESSPDRVPSCRWVCDVDADCVTDAYRAPLRCESGYCVFAGCTSDAQCEAWWGGHGRPERCVAR